MNTLVSLEKLTLVFQKLLFLFFRLLWSFLVLLLLMQLHVQVLPLLKKILLRKERLNSELLLKKRKLNSELLLKKRKLNSKLLLRKKKLNSEQLLLRKEKLNPVPPLAVVGVESRIIIIININQLLFIYSIHNKYFVSQIKNLILQWFILYLRVRVIAEIGM